MKNRDFILSLFSFSILLAGCKENNQTKQSTEIKPNSNAIKDIPASGNIELQAPDFTDPQMKEYYSIYTTYLNNVVAAIRNKDEPAAMKLFTENGKKFDDKNEMDSKAQAAEEQKFNAWLMQSLKYNQEIVQSPYYKKFNEEYYKKVKEDFKKKGL